MKDVYDLMTMLQQRRKQRGLSYRELAALSGVDHTSIYRMLTGCQETSIAKVAFVARALGVQLVLRAAEKRS